MSIVGTLLENDGRYFKENTKYIIVDFLDTHFYLLKAAYSEEFHWEQIQVYW